MHTRYEASAADNPPWIKPLAKVRHLASLAAKGVGAIGK
jgi:hypothetical protein